MTDWPAIRESFRAYLREGMPEETLRQWTAEAVRLGAHDEAVRTRLLYSYRRALAAWEAVK